MTFPHSRVARSVSVSRWETTVKSCAVKEFVLHNKVTDSYHAEYIIYIRRAARVFMHREEKISIRSIYRPRASRTCAIPTFQTDLHENRAIKMSVVISFTVVAVKRLLVICNEQECFKYVFEDYSLNLIKSRNMQCIYTKRASKERERKRERERGKERKRFSLQTELSLSFCHICKKM